jgi:organic radical activating enzyme
MLEEDDINTNKQFRVYEESGKHLRLSVDEAIARNLNTWQGWKCSSGVRALYIDFDGNLWICNTASSKVYRFNYEIWETLKASKRPKIMTDSWVSECEKLSSDYRKSKGAYKKIFPNTPESKQQYPGFLGNIYDGYDLPTEWFVCPWETCGCGADVILSKAKTESHKNLLAVTNHSWKGRDRTLHNAVNEIAESVAVEMNFQIPYQILWDIGRRCNYDCSYCWASVHNRTDDHKDYNLIIKTIDNLISKWAKYNTIRWNFGGGEPTLHPKFLDILKYLKDNNQWAMVTSNGTRDHKYWAKAIENLNSVNLSAHFDGLLTDKEEDRFVRNIETICEHFDMHNDDHWLEIKIMAPPQYIDRALKLKEKIKALGILDVFGANNRIKGFLSLVPIRSLGDSGVLVEYTPEQLEIFKHQ